MKHILPSEVLDQHVAILGKTRSGKSTAMRGLVEGILKSSKPVCIVDPKGDWWGIKLAADGKGPGFPVVIFGGEHGDVPINEHAGAHVAELFATGNRPCLIDLGGWMVGARTRFWIDFASTLFKLTKGQRWLAVDEFHNFAPKGKVFDADAGKALHWSNRLASEGLGKGLGMIFASQRPQKVHNDALTSAETLIAMRVIHLSDRKAIAEWIKGCGDGQGADVLGSLANLERGEGWVWSPEVGFGPKRVKFPMFETYDSFRAQTPEEAKRLKGWAEVDLDDVRNKLAAVVKEAEANDPKLLRAEVARLKAELAKRPTETKEIVKEVRVEVPVLANGQLERTELLVKSLKDVADSVSADMSELQNVVSRAKNVQRPWDAKPSIQPTSPKASIQTPRPTRRETPVDSGELTGPQQAILDTIHMLNTRGIDANRDSVARWLGIHPNGGSYGTNLGYLRSNGYLESCTLTERGRQAARDQETGLDAALRALEDEPKRNIIRALIDAGQPITRDELAERLGLHPNGGSYGTNLGRLRTMGLITERGPIAPTEGLYR